MHKQAVLILILAAGLTGCGESEEAAPANGSPQPSGPVSVAPTAPASVSIAPPPAGPPTAQLTPPGGAPAAPAASGAEYNGEVAARDDDGNRLNGEAFLKKAMMYHVEGKGHPYPTRIEELVELGTLKSLPEAPAGQKWAIDPKTRQIVLQ